MNYELRYEIQGATQQWVDSFISQYGVSATEMVDALNNVLVQLKDKAVQELLNAAYAQQIAMAQNREKEVTNGELNETDLQD